MAKNKGTVGGLKKEEKNATKLVTFQSSSGQELASIRADGSLYRASSAILKDDTRFEVDQSGKMNWK